MPLCPTVRSCGCSVISNSLAISGDGTTGNPWDIELSGTSETLPTYSFADTAERDAMIPFPVEGQRVWIRGTHEDHVYRAGAWRVFSRMNSYTPVVSGSGWAIGGTGSVTGQYSVSAGICFLAITLTFGGTGVAFSTNTAMSLSLPVHAHTAMLGAKNMSTICIDNGTNNRYAGRALIGNNLTTVLVTTFLVATTRVIDQTVLATIPHAWASGDQIIIGGSYLTDV